MSHSPTSEDQSRDSYEDGWGAILKLINSGGSWSGRERNCCLLNTGGERFADVSAVTGLDFLDDGRSVATVDWDLDGDLDLWMTARTGPRVRFIRNDSVYSEDKPKASFVAFQLQGVACNRDAIGARVEVTLGDRVLLRSLRAESAYLTQPSKWLHFGIGKSQQIDSVKVVWPGGDSQTFTPLDGNRHYTLKQGESEPIPWSPPERRVSLTPAKLPTRIDELSNRVVLYDRMPAPTLHYSDFKGIRKTIPTDRPTLVTLWATWCKPCVTEFNQMEQNANALRENGLTVIALSVDGIDGQPSDRQAEIAKAEAFWSTRKYSFDAGMADVGLLNRLDVLSQLLISLRTQPDAIPYSYLFDKHGRLAMIYPGPIETTELLRDVASLERPPLETVFPFAGEWFQAPDEAGGLIVEFAEEFYRRKDMEVAGRYALLAADLSSRDAVSTKSTESLASILFNVGTHHVVNEAWPAAAQQLSACVQIKPGQADSHANLGFVYRQLEQPDLALEHLILANQINPKLLPVHLNLGMLLLDQGEAEAAAEHLQRCIELEPNMAEARELLGLALARTGQRGRAQQQLERAALLGSDEARRHLKKLREGGTP